MLLSKVENKTINGVKKLNAEKYLKQIKSSEVRIQRKQVELYQLNCLATQMTAPMGTEPIQVTGTSDKVGNISAKIVDLENYIKRLIEKFIADKEERIAVIEQVDDVLLYTILHKHYVEYKKISTIAKEEHYSDVHISNKHQEALERVQEILDKKERQG